MICGTINVPDQTLHFALSEGTGNAIMHVIDTLTGQFHVDGWSEK